jgi:hypothetical protein
MQRWRIAIIIVGIILIGGVVAFEVYNVTQRYLASTLAAATSRCTGEHEVIRVTISHNAVAPLHSTGNLCNELIITNLDSSVRLVAFGSHDSHQPYDGVAEQLLGQGQTLKVTLNRAGNFEFHDHLHDTVVGTFTVQ